jgi:hypothetical protein
MGVGTGDVEVETGNKIRPSDEDSRSVSDPDQTPSFLINSIIFFLKYAFTESVEARHALGHDGKEQNNGKILLLESFF